MKPSKNLGNLFLPDVAIYDFGANNGDDLRYYLMKAEFVVAIEANPELCDLIEHRHGQAIREGRLRVINKLVCAEADQLSAPFFVHKRNHVLSQAIVPDTESAVDFEEIHLESITPSGLIDIAPLYVKVDLEGIDHLVLDDLFQNRIFPKYISSECHSIAVLGLITTTNFYNSYNLVNGYRVGTRYHDTLVTTNAGSVRFRFAPHSAGPFGEDIGRPWLSERALVRMLGVHGLGWIDIHATHLDEPPTESLSLKRAVFDYTKDTITHLFRGWWKPDLLR